MTAVIERGRLAYFAKAIGESDPIYSDIEAAQADGHPDLPVPPTFLFGLKLDVPDPFGWIEELGVDMHFLLHGKQAFTYRSMLYAGDTVTLTPTIIDVYEKKGGSLEFIVCATEVTRADGVAVATLEETLVVRHPGLEIKP
ncbi:MaoC family dehydratase N-terminal domain-containing protein [Pseudarthrobacter sp. MDT3-9]|nr:MaoC family dehydratase N-terminal domain-containing protein [Pseudarthrobacter sp. MDT3-9]